MKNFFISSTFKDFHYERDVLRNVVMPSLNECARKYGEFISFCDLRWGIDTTGEKEYGKIERILSGCLDEIDRCRPYMIVLLGDRYGFVMHDDFLKREALNRKLLLEDYNISVTQLEIEYGALQATDVNVFYYFREIVNLEQIQINQDYLPECEAYYKKLAALKDKIRQKHPGRVKTYHVDAANLDQLQEFSKMVIQDLRTELEEKEWKKYSKMSIYEKDSLVQWKFLEDKSKCFKVGHTFAKKIIDSLKQTNNSVIHLVSGDDGSGKSTLFSHICLEMKKNWIVLPFFCGITSISSSEEEILNSMLWHLETTLALSHRDLKKLCMQEKKIYLNSLCIRLKEYRILIAVDATEFFSNIQDVKRFYFIPDVKSDRISILLTTKKQISSSDRIHTFTVAPLTQSEKHKVIQDILDQNGKSLSNTIINAIVQKQSSNNPLFLYMAVNRLCLMNREDYHKINRAGGEIEHINRYLLHMIDGMTDNLSLLSAEVLRTIADKIFPKSINRCLDYLAASRHGLRYTDLEALLAKEQIILIPLHFSQYIHFLQELFVLKEDSFYDFFHQSIRSGFPDNPELHGQLADYMMSLPENDKLRKSECVYHLLRSGQNDKLTAFVAENGRRHVYILEDIFLSLMNGKQQWLLDIVRNNLNENARTDFLQFLGLIMHHASVRMREVPDALSFAFSLGKSCEYLLQKLAETCQPDTAVTDELMERACVILNTNQQNCQMLSEILQNLGNADDIPIILEYYEKQKQFAVAIYNIRQDVYSADKIADLYVDIANYLNSLGNRSQSEEYLLEALDIRKKIAHKHDELRIYYEELRCYVASHLYETALGKKKKRYSQDIIQSTAYIREYAKRYPHPENLMELSNALLRLANLYFMKRYTKNYPDAFPIYQEALEIREKMYLEKRSDGNMEELIETYITVGAAYVNTNKKENIRKALEYFEKGYHFIEEKLLACPIPEVMILMIRLCTCITNAAVELSDGETLENAYRICQISSYCAVELVSKMPIASNIEFLIDIFANKAQICMSTRELYKLEEMIRLYQKILPYFSESALNEEQYTLLSGYANMLSLFGECYRIFGSKASYQKAIPWFEKALEKIDLLINRWQEHFKYQRDKSGILNSLAFCLMELGQLERARACTEESVRIAEYILEKTKLDYDKRDLSFSYIYCGDIYVMYKEYHQAAEYYYKAAKLRKEVDQSLDTPASRRSLAIIYEKLANIHCLMEGAENIALFMKYSEKACDLLRALANKSKNTVDMVEAANALYRLAITLMSKSTSDFIKPIELLKESSMIYDQIDADEFTYNDLMNYLQCMFQTASMYENTGEFEKAEQLRQIIILKSERFYQRFPSAEYATLICDVKMKLIHEYCRIQKENWHEICMGLYEECRLITYGVWKETNLNQHLSNLIFICYEEGLLYLEMEFYEEAIECFKQAITCTEALPEEVISIETRIIYYEMLSYTGRLMMSHNSPEFLKKAENYFKKAIQAECDAFKTLEQKDTEDIYRYAEEIKSDMRRDEENYADTVLKLGNTDCALDHYEKTFVMFYQAAEQNATPYVEDLIRLTLQIFQLYLGAEHKMKNFEKMYCYQYALVKLAEQNPQVKILNEIAEMIQQQFQDLEKKGTKITISQKVLVNPIEDILKIYARAEELFSLGKFSQSEPLFEKFLKKSIEIPESEKTRTLWIRIYNAYSTLAIGYANQNTQESYKKAIAYFADACATETSARELFGYDDLEILQDMIEDMEHMLNIKEKVGETGLSEEYACLISLLQELLPFKKAESIQKIILNSTLLFRHLDDEGKDEVEKQEIILKILMGIRGDNLEQFFDQFFNMFSALHYDEDEESEDYNKPVP